MGLSQWWRRGGILFPVGLIQGWGQLLAPAPKVDTASQEGPEGTFARHLPGAPGTQINVPAIHPHALRPNITPSSSLGILSTNATRLRRPCVMHGTVRWIHVLVSKMGTNRQKPHSEPPKGVSPSSQDWGGRTGGGGTGGNFAQRARVPSPPPQPPRRTPTVAVLLWTRCGVLRRRLSQSSEVPWHSRGAGAFFPPLRGHRAGGWGGSEHAGTCIVCPKCWARAPGCVLETIL